MPEVGKSWPLCRLNQARQTRHPVRADAESRAADPRGRPYGFETALGRVGSIHDRDRSRRWRQPGVNFTKPPPIPSSRSRMPRYTAEGRVVGAEEVPCVSASNDGFERASAGTWRGVRRAAEAIRSASSQIEKPDRGQGADSASARTSEDLEMTPSVRAPRLEGAAALPRRRANLSGEVIMSRALRLVSIAVVIATYGLTAAQSPDSHEPGSDAVADDHRSDSRSVSADHDAGSDRRRSGGSGGSVHMEEPGRLGRRPHDRPDDGRSHGHLHARFSMRRVNHAGHVDETNRRRRHGQCHRVDPQPDRVSVGRNVGRALSDGRCGRAARPALHLGVAGDSAGGGIDAHRTCSVRPAGRSVKDPRPPSRLACASRRCFALGCPPRPSEASGVSAVSESDRGLIAAVMAATRRWMDGMIRLVRAIGAESWNPPV